MRLEDINISTREKNILNKNNIGTVEALTRHFPRKVYDFRKTLPVTDEHVNTIIAVEGIFKCVKKNEKSNSVSGQLIDGYTGRILYISWFGTTKLYYYLKKFTNCHMIVCGKLKKSILDNNFMLYSMTPFAYSFNAPELKKIMTIYPKHAGMSDETLKKLISKAVQNSPELECLPLELIQRYKLLEIRQAVYELHYPTNAQRHKAALNRMLFDDMLYFSLKLLDKEKRYAGMSDIVLKKEGLMNQMINSLPYKLTADQLLTVTRLKEKMQTGRQTNAIVIGDVGCGKSIVAFLLMILAAENGYQSVLMAPTAILAKQHYEELCRLTENFQMKVAFLGSKQKTKEKNEIIKGIENGEYHFIVGTHSVASLGINYKNLGLNIIDEEHKFGVEQRETISNRIPMGIHSISMSATPIPRSISSTLLSSQIDVCNIKTKPNGRKPVKTDIYSDIQDILNILQREIQNGHQAYVVCPMIEEVDEDNILYGIHSVNETIQIYKQHFEPLGIQVCSVTGKTKKEDAEKLITEFAENKYQILISTTVIEVGVNVPNATVIVITNAERFGLAGLHQLRGRVGRSELQSYCCLYSEEVQNGRLQAMCSTNDGFKIAEIDFELRGGGDVINTLQAGKNKYLEQILNNPPLFKAVKKIATTIDNESSERFIRSYETANH